MAVTKGRWAIIIKETGEVSDIKQMEGGKPDIRNADRYDVVEVDADVKIGMVRKGDGFAFPAPERQAEAGAEAKDPEGDGDKAADAGGAKTVDAGKPAKGKGGKAGGKTADAGGDPAPAAGPAGQPQG